MGSERRFESSVLWLALAIAAPGTLVSLGLVFWGHFSAKLQWTLGLFVALGGGLAIWTLMERVVYGLQTATNLLAALREGDYSIRASRVRRDARPSDALGELFFEINELGETLRRQRYDEEEAGALLQAVMAELEVAVFAFDARSRLKLVNRAGERLLSRSQADLLGRAADELGLGECLQGESTRTLACSFPGAAGRFGLRRTRFRRQGQPLSLVVLSDLSQPLREEEKFAWQRMARVLSHELNNSLAPIKSMSATLDSLLARQPWPDDIEEDLRRGLAVIGSRADALARFTTAYSRMARLPPPRPRSLEIGAWLEGVVGLEQRMHLLIQPGPPVTLQADPDQLEQLLINLIRNAVDAALEAGGKVELGWSVREHLFELWIRDEGLGILNPANLFVPFFTTKKQGSGIGLALCRQIAEAHGGHVTLENRRDRQGGEAILRLPLPT